MTKHLEANERGTVLVTQGEFSGWRYWPADSYEVHAGPFYYQREGDGRVRTAFRAEQKHMNSQGAMHGGVFLTFADFSLFAIAWDELADGRGVTISMTSEFIGAGALGDLIEGHGEVVKATRSLIFLQGRITCEGRPLFTYSAIIKRLGK